MPSWLRIALAALALVAAVMVVVLTWAEQTAGARARRRGVRAWVEDHFVPRGRGVPRRGEPGAYFTGRVHALGELVAWLGTDRGGLCVVTGNPGSGKSAVLGRLVALADPKRRRDMGIAGLPTGTVPPAGAFDVAVWAKGLTMADVVAAIGATIGSSATTPDELIDAVLESGRRLVVVVDALDEAGGEGEARRVAQRLLKPLAVAGQSFGVKILVGSRRGPRNELLDALGRDARVIDLDAPNYLQGTDVVEYVRRRLLREAEPGARTAYRAQPALAARVAGAIADRAGSSFLVAQLVSGAVAAADVVDTSRRGWENQFAGDVGSAMDDYLDRFATESDRRRARDLLTALAYAEGAGLPRDPDDDVWPRLATAVAARRYNADDIDWVLHTAAADLVEETSENGTVTCRLFHQALSDHLRGPVELQRQRQQAFSRALEATVPTSGAGDRDWSRAHSYIRSHLGAHAAAGGLLDRLLEDPEFLIAADPPGLLRALHVADGGAAAAVRRAYRQVAHLLPEASSGERAAYLEMAARSGGPLALAERIAQRHPDRPWTARWARWRVGGEHFVVGRHDDGAPLVSAVALAELDGRPVAVSASTHQTLRAWDLDAGGELGEPIAGDMGAVWALALAELVDGTVIVAGGNDGTLRAWNLADGGAHGDQLTGHRGAVRTLAVGRLDGRAVVVSGGDDGTVRAWSLATGTALGEPLLGHAGRVRAVAVGTLDDGRTLAVSGGDDGTLRVWDLAAATARGKPLTGHQGAVSAVAVAELGGRPVIVSGGVDRTLRVWDLADGTARGSPLTGHGSTVLKVAAGEFDDRPVAVSAGFDMTLRMWDLATGRPLGEPLTGPGWLADAVAVGVCDHRPLAVSAGDASVRLWDLTAVGSAAKTPLSALDGAVTTVAVGELGGHPVAVSGGDDATLRVWDLADGSPRGTPLSGHHGAIHAVAVGRLDRDPVIVSGGEPAFGRSKPASRPTSLLTVCVWNLAADPPTGRPLSDHYGTASAVAVSTHDGRPLVSDGRPVIVCAGDDEIRVWDLAAGTPRGDPLARHPDGVTTLAIGELAGRPVIVSGGRDGALRVWDLATGMPRGDALMGHGAVVNAVAVSGLDGGLAVSGDDDGTLLAWNLVAGAPHGDPIAAHNGAVKAVAAIEHGRRPLLVSGGEDETVRVWNLAGSELCRITVDSWVHTIAARAATLVLGADAGIMAIEIKVPTPAH